MTAAPQMAKKDGAAVGQKVTVSQKAVQAPQKAKGSKVSFEMPKRKTISAGTNNKLTKALKSSRVSIPAKAVNRSDAPTNLKGLVIYADGWSQDYAPKGLYSIPTSDAMTFDMLWGLSSEAPLSYSATKFDEYYGGFFYEDYGIFTLAGYSVYNAESGEVVYTTYIDETTDLAFALAEDPTTGDFYGISYYDDGGEYLSNCLAKYTLSESGYTREMVGTLEGNWNSIAVDADGTIYAINNEGNLYKLDKATAAATLVGATGFVPNYMSSAAIDTKTSKMYWTVNPADETGFICEVDKTTGAATVLYNFPLNDEVIGLVADKPAAEEKAPAAASNLAASFPEGAMTGKFTFDAPATTFDGAAATGAVNYKVIVNGVNVVEAGSATYGQTGIEVPYTADAPGNYTAVVTFYNQVGDSPKAKVAVYIGKGVPAGTTVSAAYDNATGVVTVSWLPVVESADGGYFNPAEVVYDVYRVAGEEETLVAENLTATTFTETITVPEELTAYSYKVIAKYNGTSSVAAVSNTITLGSVTPPYLNEFTSDLGGFTQFDANADGKVWIWYSESGNGLARCSYNSTLTMDDWLFSVPLKLEGGKLYRVSFDAWGSNSFPEKIEVKFGKSATPEGMTTEILPATVVKAQSEETHFEVEMVPAENGIYFLGFHGVSEPDQFYLKLDNVAVSAPMSAEAPAAVENLTATADPTGALKVDIAFNAPSKAMSGADLTALTKIEVLRADQVIKTFEAPAVGADLSCTDQVDASGTYTYSVVAYNADGAGKEAKISCFVGFDEPAAPESAQMVETATPGEVTVSWTAVTTDIQGKTVPADRISYAVMQYGASGWEQVDITSENSYTYQAVPAGEQDFVQCAVFPILDGQQGEGAFAGMIAAGTPYTDLNESFADGQLGYIWGINTEGGAEPGIYNDSSINGITSMDGDNGFMGFQASYLDDSADFFSGKIDLSNLAAPGLTMYTYNIVGTDGSEDINEIVISIKEGNGDFIPVLTTTPAEVADGQGDGWYKMTVNLAAYAGKTIEFQITATAKIFGFTFFDGIKVGNLLANDLKAGKVVAPETVAAGADYQITFPVTNEGSAESGAFTVEVSADGELIKTFEGTPLAAGAKVDFVLDQTMSPLATQAVNYSATIVYAADEDVNNNVFDNFAVSPKVSNLPKVLNLKSATVGNDVQLTWEEPDLTAAPAEPVTIDFEDGESFAKEYADWTFVDEDGEAVGGFQNMDLPGITPGETLASFFVFNVPAANGNQTFAAHSGDNYLASLFLYSDGQASDWAISPALNDGGQTVTFWARSYSTQYPEKIEICYSNGSTNPADFTVDQTVNPVPGTWTEYTVELPAGASRFAIHSCAAGSFMLMIDDVTFIPAEGEAANLSIIGYNIYRDGELLNAEPVAECEFIDAAQAAEDHSYAVVTVYDKGASAPEFIAFTSGIDSVDADANAAKAEFFDTKGIRVNSEDLAPGIYIRRQGAKVTKVIVK